jgi:ACS family glucarate transporter-like MFS transporter
MNMGGQLGGAVTASLTPLIALHFGWNVSFLTATIFAAVGALAWLVVNPDARLSQIVDRRASAISFLREIRR